MVSRTRRSRVSVRTPDTVRRWRAKFEASGVEAFGPIAPGRERWCLWLVHADPRDIRTSPELAKRLQAVRKYRSDSKRATTRHLAATPGLFGEIRQPAR